MVNHLHRNCEFVRCTYFRYRGTRNILYIVLDTEGIEEVYLISFEFQFCLFYFL